jgi:hypothetical protein
MKKVIAKTLIACAVGLIMGELVGHIYYAEILARNNGYFAWKPIPTWKFDLTYFNKTKGYTIGIITFAVLLIIFMIPELKSQRNQ